jgi:3'(2'), 5'-bisphosphate nucleotidase
MQLAKLARWLDQLVPTVRAAGDLVMAVYASDFQVDIKADHSPVTEADEMAEVLIARELHLLTPGIQVVGEEAASAGLVECSEESFWLIDPLDGTREFVERNGEFTVNIALVHKGRPVLGLVLLPALGRLYGGVAGWGSWVEEGGVRTPIRCRQRPPEGLRVLASRSHGDEGALRAYLAGQKVARILYAGSSLKLCLLAEGKADVYPRFGRTMEWDIAAGQAILEAAGGRVEQLDGVPLAYGKVGFENPHFVAWGQR